MKIRGRARGRDRDRDRAEIHSSYDDTLGFISVWSERYDFFF